MKNLSLNDIRIGKKSPESDSKSNRIIQGKVRKKDMAIIGMAIKVGSSDNIDEFWETISSGKTDLSYVDEQRKEDFFNFMEAEYGLFRRNEVRFKKISAMKDVDKFDGDFFKINPVEAQMMDPVQRLFLQTSYHALENAGYGAENINGRNIGVYLGYTEDDTRYCSQLYREEDCDDGKVFTGNMSSVIPSRISYHMNLKGPSLSVDTGCSSSLVAIHHAMTALINEDCEMAVVGGIRYNFVPSFLNFGQMDIFSYDGVTRSFDDFADGTNNGEASCAIVIKQLSKALEDNDSIYAVIKGSAVNNDGASLGITAPNMDAQENMLAQAWKNSDVNPDTISYIECHGTGTHIGDPIEVNAIINAFKKYTDRKQFCAIGSVKSNISHSGPASGVTSIIKTVLSMNNRVIPPSLHFDVPNSTIDFIDSPVYVNTKLKKWDTDIIRCGVNAFSMNGTNVHIVMEEYKEKRPVTTEDKYKILCLSALKKESLSKMVDNYIEFLDNHRDVSLSDLTYTVNTSRKLCEYRIAVVFETIEQLVNELKNYSEQILENKISSVNMKNNLLQSDKIIADYINGNKTDRFKLEELKKIFCDGFTINWKLMYDKDKYRRISAPLYPFYKQRHWFEFNGVRHFENKFENECRNMIENKNLPEDLKQQLEKLTEEISKFNSENKNNCTQTKINLLGRDNADYTDAEIFIAQKCFETFGYKDIDINDGLDVFNADSLQMTTLYSKMRSSYNMSLTDLYKYDSIKRLAENIGGSKMDIYDTVQKLLESQKNNESAEHIDYYSVDRKKYIERVKNSNDIDINNKKSYNNIMLTGATGYLGIYILKELLENTASVITLILRRRGDSTVFDRLKSKFGKYFDCDLFEKSINRLDIYEGDMLDCRFGLGNEYDSLADSVDCIIHCAAYTSHFGEYSDFYEANVCMTENIIMFAEEGQRKDIKHISTYAVAQFNGSGKGVFFTEFDNINVDHIEDVTVYYPRTKIIAENLMNSARERGINVSIFRLDDILFEYQRGVMQENIENNAIALIIRSFVELGTIPDVNGIEYEFTFVDYAAKAIVLLMHLSETASMNLHISNSSTTDLRECLSDSSLDIVTDLVPFEEFLNRGLALFENDKPEFAYFNDILIHFFDGGNISEDYRASGLGFEYTVKVLEKMNFYWPRLDADVFNKFLKHCVDVGFIKKTK